MATDADPDGVVWIVDVLTLDRVQPIEKAEAGWLTLLRKLFAESRLIIGAGCINTAQKQLLNRLISGFHINSDLILLAKKFPFLSDQMATIGCLSRTMERVSSYEFVKQSRNMKAGLSFLRSALAES